jgi:hypothetical protein
MDQGKDYLMRNLLVLGIVTAALAVGAASGAANAANPNPNVPTWSPYTMIRVPAWRPMAEGRAASVAPAWAGPANGPVDYKSVGLSNNPDDCNNGCAVSNGD